METKEEMVLEVIEATDVNEVTDEIVKVSSNKNFKPLTSFGLGVIGGIFAYKYLYKPIKARLNKKIEQADTELEELVEEYAKEIDEMGTEDEETEN